MNDRAFGWALVGIGAVFGLIAANMIRTGLIVNRSVRISRAKDPQGFRSSIRWLIGFAAIVAAFGTSVLILG